MRRIFICKFCLTYRKTILGGGLPFFGEILRVEDSLIHCISVLYTQKVSKNNNRVTQAVRGDEKGVDRLSYSDTYSSK
jgi:hypothetical protein